MTALASTVDGTMADPTLNSKFFEKCALITTGNVQTRTLPMGLTFSTTDCSFSGTPLSVAAVTTAFCSDPAYTSQATCEASVQTWNATTLKCSNPDYLYATQAVCTSTKNKWYKIGSSIPYRITMTYHNSAGEQSTITTTVGIGAYKAPTGFALSQSDKLILHVQAQSGYFITDIVPTVTTTASVGAYARSNIIAGATSATGVAKIVDTVANKIGINKLVALYVNDSTPFAINGFISVLGTCSNATYVTKTSCLGAAGTWTSSGKVAKIFDKDDTYGVLYVENISPNNQYFATNDKISSDALGEVAASFITEADDSYLFSDATADNDSQFYTAKYGIQKIVSIYETGSTKFIKPIVPIGDDSLSAANGTTFKISPALPAGVNFDTATGIISGAFSADLATTKFTVTATNSLGSNSTFINLSAITAPGDFAVSNKQIITVTSTALFKEGEELIQPIAPPSTEALKAKVLKILNNYQMAIEVYNGDFLAGASIDNGNVFKTEKTSIIPTNTCSNANYTTKASCEAASYVWSPGPIYYNTALTLNSSGSYVVGDTITTTGVVAANTNGAGAKALVVNVFTSARDILYVQYFTQTATGVATAKTFYEGDTVNSGTTIYQVNGTNMKLELTSNTGFLSGQDVATTSHASAYAYALNGSIISVSDITKQPAGTLFKVGDAIYNDETTSIATNNTTISSSTFDNLFVLERGKKTSIHGFQTTGNGMIFTITPALPTGLALDPSTGSISGTPTYLTARRDYLITGTNFINSTLYTVSLEVRDYFQLADKSGVSSYLFHKVGDAQINRKCRINASDILSGPPSKALDIRCFLDGEEEDMFFSGLNFNALVGAGICQYIQYAPYFFEQWSPKTSAGTSTKYPVSLTVKTGCISSGNIPTPDLCEAYYATSTHPEYPNCDEGFLTYTQEVWTTDASSVCNTVASSTVQKVQCGGNRYNCASGPVRDLLTPAQMNLGFRSMIYSSSTGADISWPISAPTTHGDGTNLRVANGTVNNACLTTNADANTWTGTVKSINMASHPFGMYDPITDSYPGANPFYTFYCMDAAKDIKARIRVSVREWDRTFRIDSGIDTQTTNTLMNAGVTLDTFGIKYNNYSDWDDDYSLSGAAGYSGGSCGSIGAGTDYKFPEDKL